MENHYITRELTQMVVTATLWNLGIAWDRVADVVHVRDGGLHARIKGVDLFLRHPFGPLEELLLARCVRCAHRLLMLLHAAQAHLRRLLGESFKTVFVELLHTGQRVFDGSSEKIELASQIGKSNQVVKPIVQTNRIIRFTNLLN